MKKATIYLAFALVLILSGCGKAEVPQAEARADLESMAEEMIMTPEAAKIREKSESVSQEDKETAITRRNSDEGVDLESQSDTKPDPEILNAGSEPTRVSESVNPPGSGESASRNPEAGAQPEVTPSQPVQSETASTNPTVAETPIEPIPEQVPEVSEQPPAKTIYDYEFDVEAIRLELIGLGQSMGLTHMTEDDGIACTPDTCSWASPITASENFQGDRLERALKDYVTSMPSLLSAYGGTQITSFCIYVQSNGGGSYTFYFLY